MIDVYNLRCFSSIRTHTLQMVFNRNVWFKNNVRIWMSTYRENGFFCNIAKTRADWAKWWLFLDSASPDYPKKVVVHPAAKWLLTNVICQSISTEIISFCNDIIFSSKLIKNWITYTSTTSFLALGENEFRSPVILA